MCVVSKQSNIQSCFIYSKMERYIRESFFNPILHILPILLFLVLEDVSDMTNAWLYSLPAAFLLQGYVWIYYKSIFRWHLVSSAVYLSIGIIITLVNVKGLSVPFNIVFGELVAATFMLLLALFKKFFFKVAVSMTSKKMAMQNNLNELVRMAYIFCFLFLLFVIVYTFYYYEVQDHAHHTLVFIYQLYITLLIMAIIYEFIRVYTIRDHLSKEEWLPIVDNIGQEIGSIQREESFLGDIKHIHPVVRVIVVEGNRIFLRKNSFKEDVDLLKWDNALTSHMLLKESSEKCIQRSFQQMYGVTNIHPIFLSNYLLENHKEIQFVHLYISCRLHDIHPNPEYSNAVKWWTIQQIKEELESGIFTESFIKEYTLLQRSGLIDTGKCNCECKLRDHIEGRVWVVGN